MFRFIAIVFLLLIITLSELTANSQTTPTNQLVVEPYTLRTFDGKQIPAELGKLSVPEDRLAKAGRKIEVAFVRLKSTATQPGPPIIWLAGGPGVPGVVFGRIPPYFELFDKLRGVSDVILLDQRGTGLSSPNLQCKPAAMPAGVFENASAWLRVFTGETRRCADAWRKQGVNIEAYNNNSSADDLEDLRLAIGADRINLLGHSYGTELALTAIRRHPASISRVVFASTEGTDNLLAMPSVWDFLIKKLSYFTAQDPSVSKFAPDLEVLYRRVLEKLERQPVVLTVTDGETKQPVQIRVGKIGLQWLVRSNIYDARFFPILPALLSTIDSGDYSLLTPRMEQLFNNYLGRSPMAMAMDCSAGWSAERLAQTSREAGPALFSNVNLQWSSNICKEFATAGGAVQPPRLWSTVPALFLSGTLDANTPPFQAEEMRWGFPDSVHLMVENGGHETLPAGEVQAVVVDFFKGEDVSNRRVAFARPKFLSIEAAKAIRSTNMH
jgi:pimeloyl-ACP methyl ester carboxylesterase